jgi:SAM-dependent methyltransferase
VPKRPLWKRLAIRARDIVYRGISVVEAAGPWQRDPLLPPAHLRRYYYRTLKADLFARHCEAAGAELMTRGLQPEHRVLDIGSGPGNLAIALIGFLKGSYDGVEIHTDAVAWCQQAITPRYPTFRFHAANVSSHAYNPQGRISPSTYRFPFPDQSFDFVFLGSVFTHMLPDAVQHYVQEIARLLAPHGTCVASCFLLNDETRADVERGHSFMSFDVLHPSGLCRLHDDVVPEAAVALEESYVRRVHEEAGLRIRDIRRGRWWNGQPHDQDVLWVERDVENGAAAPTYQ